MKELDKYIMNELSKIYQTKEEYINECKQCFLKQDKKTQKEIEEADTEELEYEIKLNNFDTFNDFRKAIKYELMLRNDFKTKI